MDRAYPELKGALSTLLDRIDTHLREGGYEGAPIRMVLAGGMAVNHYCGTRYTADVDAWFSHRVLLPWRELNVDYQRADGEASFIYFDVNYTPTLSLMHEDYEDDAQPWEGIGNDRRLVHLYVLSPVDLAVSKLSRYTSRDAGDIQALWAAGHFSVETFRARAEDALKYYIGNDRPVRLSLKLALEEMVPG